MITGVDLSSHQYPPDATTPPNFDAMRTAGIQFVVSKASEGIGYRNPNFTRDRSESYRTGMGFGSYHYARGGNPLAEADFFANTCGPLVRGEFLWLDWEVDVPNPPVWCRTFLDHLLARTGVRASVYMDRSRLTGFNWKPVVSGNYGLAVASYDNDPLSPPSPGVWSVCAFKQYTDRGSVPGISVPVDRLTFYGDRAMLDRYGYQGGKPVPTPPPAPKPKPPAPKPVPGVSSLPVLRENAKGEVIRRLQSFFNKNYPAYSNLPVTGWYGPQTVAVVAEFQHRSGIRTPDANGTIIGPKTNAALWVAGWRG